MTLSPKTNKKPHAGQGAGSFRSGMDAVQCAHSDTTSQTQKEAAIIALRAGVEAAYAGVNLALLGGFEEVHALIRRFFERGYLIDWPNFPETLSPLKKAECRWFINELNGLFIAALDSGVSNRTIQTIAYAPILASERSARHAEAFSAHRAHRARLRAERREANIRWMEGDQL